MVGMRDWLVIGDSVHKFKSAIADAIFWQRFSPIVAHLTIHSQLIKVVGNLSGRRPFAKRSRRR
jgi:hypothetical protein